MLETLPTLDSATETTISAVRRVSMMFLSIEFIARLWVAPESSTIQIGITAPKKGALYSRLKYLYSPLGLVDLFSVLPAWICVLTPVSLHWFEVAAAVSLFKLSRYVPALSLVAAVVIRQGRSIFAALVVLSILLVFSGTVIYLFESEAQSISFESIPQSLWWAISTMATVGYGDMTPITPIGRLIGGSPCYLALPCSQCLPLFLPQALPKN